MNYYLIDFDNFTTLVVKTPEPMGAVLRLMNERRGLEYNEGNYHNPRMFKKIQQIDNPSDKYKLLARELEVILI